MYLGLAVLTRKRAVLYLYPGHLNVNQYIHIWFLKTYLNVLGIALPLGCFIRKEMASER